VKSQNLVNGVAPVTEGTIFNIENNLPENRVNFTFLHNQNQWAFMFRANYYGSTIDERNEREKVGSEIFVDLSGTYNFNDNWLLTVGANNVFDTFPDKVSTRVSNGLPWPRRTPMGYDGGSWYLRAQYSWF
jgi:iron complex outermembrane receptor protein